MLSRTHHTAVPISTTYGAIGSQDSLQHQSLQFRIALRSRWNGTNDHWLRFTAPPSSARGYHTLKIVHAVGTITDGCRRRALAAIARIRIPSGCSSARAASNPAKHFTGSRVVQGTVGHICIPRHTYIHVPLGYSCTLLLSSRRNISHVYCRLYAGPDRTIGWILNVQDAKVQVATGNRSHC
jgi:hypothetical protein